MTTQRVFRLVWRANAILILIASAGTCFGIATLLWSQLSWKSQRQEAIVAAPEVGVSEAGDRMVLGRLEPIQGTTVLRGELQLQRPGAAFSSGSGTYSEIRNFLYLDRGASKGRWLLPKHDRAEERAGDRCPAPEVAPCGATTA